MTFPKEALYPDDGPEFITIRELLDKKPHGKISIRLSTVISLSAHDDPALEWFVQIPKQFIWIGESDYLRLKRALRIQ